MARGDLLCPIDGSILGLPTWTYRGPALADEAGTHAHLHFLGTLTCANGHRFRVASESELILERF